MTPDIGLLSNTCKSSGSYSGHKSGANIEVEAVGDMLTYFIDAKGFLRPTLLKDVRYCPEASQTRLSMYHLEMYFFELSGRALYQKRRNFHYKYLLDTRENSRVFQSKILIRRYESSNSRIPGSANTCTEVAFPVLEINTDMHSANAETEKVRHETESLVPQGEVSHEVMAHLRGKKRGSSPTADCRCVICDIGMMSALDIPKGPLESY